MYRPEARRKERVLMVQLLSGNFKEDSRVTGSVRTTEYVIVVQLGMADCGRDVPLGVTRDLYSAVSGAKSSRPEAAYVTGIQNRCLFDSYSLNLVCYVAHKVTDRAVDVPKHLVYGLLADIHVIQSRCLPA
jgi:hypothetical protein